MKHFILAALIATTALAVLSPDSSAAGKGMKGKKTPKMKPTPVPEKTKAFAEIKSLSGDTITIERSSTTTTYKMSNETQIRVDGRSVRSTSLKPGMHVEVTPSSIHPTLLLSVAASTPPKG